MGGMSGSMGGMSGASPMMQSPARPGQYHPEVYQQYPQQQAVGQYGHHGYGTPTMHYPHGDSDPHALYHAAQEQFNGGAESESWFDSVLASEDEAGEETGPGGAPGRGGVHRRGAVPFRQSSGRAAPLREGSNRSIVSLGSGPPLDHGYLDMGQDESSNGPHFDLLKEFAVDQIAEAQGIKVEGMPVESAAAAAAAAAAAGPDIGTAFPGEYTSDIADGVTSMAELESKIASLKETLVRVASVNADASPEQVARLEQDMAALERGAAAMRPAPGSVGGGGGGGGGAKPGHRRGSSFGSGTRARPPRARPVIWDGHDKDEDDADREDDGDDDDDDGDDNEGTAEGALSPLAKAAAATRRPRGADGGRGAHRAAALAAQQQQRTSGFQRVPSRVSEGSEMDADHNSDGDDGASPRAPSPALRAAQMRAAAAASHARYNRARQPFIPPAQQGSPILWAIDDFSPEWDAETGGGKVLVTGTPGTGLPEGLSLCCVFGDVEVPAEQVSPGVLRCRAPPMNAGRVPFYISCLGSGKRPASDIRTFEYREAGAGGARGTSAPRRFGSRAASPSGTFSSGSCTCSSARTGARRRRAAAAEADPADPADPAAEEAAGTDRPAPATVPPTARDPAAAAAATPAPPTTGTAAGRPRAATCTAPRLRPGVPALSRAGWAAAPGPGSRAAPSPPSTSAPTPRWTRTCPTCPTRTSARCSRRRWRRGCGTPSPRRRSTIARAPRVSCPTPGTFSPRARTRGWTRGAWASSTASRRSA